MVEKFLKSVRTVSIFIRFYIIIGHNSQKNTFEN